MEVIAKLSIISNSHLTPYSIINQSVLELKCEYQHSLISEDQNHKKLR